MGSSALAVPSKRMSLQSHAPKKSKDMHETDWFSLAQKGEDYVPNCL